MAKNVAAVLRRAAELIATPEKWCKNNYARDEDGFSCAPDAHRAKQWCVFGALAKVCNYEESIAAEEALIRIIREEPTGWNDHHRRTHAEVLAALRAAAEAEERTK